MDRVRGVLSVVESDQCPECVSSLAERRPHRRVVVDRLAHRVYYLRAVFGEKLVHLCLGVSSKALFKMHFHCNIMQ